MLIVETSGDSPEEAAAGIERIARTIERRGLGYHTLKVTDPRQQATIWAVRRDGLGLIMSVEGTAKPLPFVEDTAVPPERLPEYFQRFDELSATRRPRPPTTDTPALAACTSARSWT